MSARFGGWCSQAWADLGLPVDCCGSCHDEWDEGYGEATDWTLNGVRYKACCRLGTAIEAAGGDISSQSDFDMSNCENGICDDPRPHHHRLGMLILKSRPTTEGEHR